MRDIVNRINYGADVNETDSNGTTALMATLGLGYPTTASLLRRGADVHTRDIHGRTALHYAAQIQNDPLLQLLIDAGADVNAASNDGVTPLTERPR